MGGQHRQQLVEQRGVVQRPLAARGVPEDVELDRRALRQLHVLPDPRPANLLGPQMLLDSAIGYGSAWVVEAAAVIAITGLVAQAGARLAAKITRAIKEYIEDESGSFDWNRGRPKRVNLPKLKGIDMEEVLSGHTKGGSRITPKNTKDLFPEGMTPKQIERAIKESYSRAKQITPRHKGPRLKVKGFSDDGMEIEMRINIETGIIETAYPTGNRIF